MKVSERKGKTSGFRRFLDLFSRKSESKISEEEIVTVGDLLSRDDVNCILSNLVKNKSSIKKLIVIREDDQGVMDWNASEMKMTNVVGLLEMVKMYVMMDHEYNECSEDD
jgi:hypothetical protein